MAVRVYTYNDAWPHLEEKEKKIIADLFSILSAMKAEIVMLKMGCKEHRGTLDSRPLLRASTFLPGNINSSYSL